jgi:uncharacterized membrane protein
MAMRDTSREQWRHGPLRDIGAEQLARGLGWFSIGLGLAELLAPRAVARLCGGEGRHTAMIRMYGLREIAAGLMIFSEGRRPATGMWSRVMGDAMDIATLAAAYASPRTNKAGVAFGTVNVLAVTALDIMCAQELSRQRGDVDETGAVRVSRSIVVNRSPEEVYRFWRDLENLPHFMLHLESVEVTGPRTSHWVTKGPAGTRVEWNAEIDVDRPNEEIGWRSTAGSDVQTTGSVRFEPRPGGRGTIVRVEFTYDIPGGALAATVAKLFNQAPEQQVYDDLRRLKQVLETGEVLRSDASPEGTGGVKPRPARPLPR